MPNILNPNPQYPDLFLGAVENAGTFPNEKGEEVAFHNFLLDIALSCSSVKKKAKINRPNRINRQERAKKKPNYCTNFQSRQAKGNRSDCEYGSCCKKRRYIQRPACKHAESPLS